MKRSGDLIHFERSAAQIRVLFFHHAGGSALSYLPLARALPADCDPFLFELPARTGRSHLDFRLAVDHLSASAAPVVDRPTVLFGHSIGALIAHAVLASLPEDRADLVRLAVFSASRSPHSTATLARHPSEPFAIRSRSDLLADLRDYDGCPPELFADPELLEEAVTRLGSDLHLADTYVEPSRHPSEHTAYEVWSGATDHSVPDHELGMWSRSLPTRPRIRRFPGGHFYLLNEPMAADVLRTLVSDSPVRNGRPDGWRLRRAAVRRDPTSPSPVTGSVGDHLQPGQ